MIRIKRGLREDKRAMEMAFGTIVTIVLSLTLLIFLLVFLMGGFTSFREKINNYISKSNVDSVVDSCNFLVDGDSPYEYCCVNKTIKLSNNQKLEMSCYRASTQTWASGKIKALSCTGTC